MKTSNKTQKTKFIFVTGGVLSSLGKGLAAAAIGALLESRGLTVTMQKLDPYINVDPGTMNPFQHGEVYVTDDGAETDLDLGHYERYTSAKLGQKHNYTSGRIYYSVITKERRGEYLGGTVQIDTYYRVLRPVGRRWKVFVHMDGDLKPLWKAIGESKIGGIDSLSPTPDNDTSIADAVRLWPEMRICLNFPSSIHLKEPQVIYNETMKILEQGGHTGRLQIQISENMPPGAWKRSYPQIVKAIRDFTGD